MGEEMKVGCARPTGGPVGEAVDEQTAKARRRHRLAGNREKSR